jgi:hypothetical protein
MPPSPNLTRWEEYRRAAEAELEYISEQIESDMQREAIARAALLGERPRRWQGLHRREEAFGEVARDEVTTKFRRGVGQVAALASRVGGLLSHKRRSYGRLEDIGFGEIQPREDFSMLDATHFYTEQELNEIRDRVLASYENRGGEATA